ncbi:hypothetical protein D9M71_793950 [compost metagenome]
MSIRKALEATRAAVATDEKARELRNRMIRSEKAFQKELSAKVVSKELLSKSYSL